MGQGASYILKKNKFLVRKMGHTVQILVDLNKFLFLGIFSLSLELLLDSFPKMMNLQIKHWEVVQ